VIPAARPEFGPLEEEAVARVIRSGNLAQGSEVASFEDEFSRQVVGGAQCVAVNSGTSALHLSLLALGIGAGDEVVVPSFTFAATANAVALTGATPVFADISPESFCIDPDHVSALITDRTVCIVPVHLYGHPADLARLNTIASNRGLAILEDAAQAHGAEIHGTPVGSSSSASAFSFYPTKNMSSGEGGMVVTRDDQVARRVRLLRNQGQEVRYRNEVVGFNNRMTDIHAAIGRSQLSRLAGWNDARIRHAETYSQALRGVDVPSVAAGLRHVYHQYTIRVTDGRRDSLVSSLAEQGIGTGVYYPYPTHQLPAFNISVDLPETTKAAAEVLSLPVYPSLTLDEHNSVVSAVNHFMGQGT
jgi:perosamine synthetase